MTERHFFDHPLNRYFLRSADGFVYMSEQVHRELDRRPDLPLLQKRFELLMTWTLPEIHCDDMHLSGLRKQGKEWLATYRFVVYATQGSEASPVIRARLKRRFPECGELLFQTGKACTVEERVRFIPVQQYGLVPEKVVLDHPELLSQM